MYLTESHALSTERQRAVRRAQRAHVDEWIATVRQLREEYWSFTRDGQQSIVR